MSDLSFTPLAEITAELVAAYVTRNHVKPDDLPGLIATIHATLSNLGQAPEAAPAPEKPTPPVSIRKSVTDDYIVCLEDGRRMKSLKRHLRVDFDMTPEQYRAKWGLPHDYPMVAPAYARQRSEMAKTMGLVSLRRKR